MDYDIEPLPPLPGYNALGQPLQNVDPPSDAPGWQVRHLQEITAVTMQGREIATIMMGGEEFRVHALDGDEVVVTCIEDHNDETWHWALFVFDTPSSTLLRLGAMLHDWVGV